MHSVFIPSLYGIFSSNQYEIFAHVQYFYYPIDEFTSAYVQIIPPLLDELHDGIQELVQTESGGNLAEKIQGGGHSACGKKLSCKKLSNKALSG